MKNKTKYLVAILLMLVSFLLIGATNVNATTTAEVNNYSDLTEKMNDNVTNVVKLTSDITLNEDYNTKISLEMSKTLDFNGFTLTIPQHYGLDLIYRNTLDLKFINSNSSKRAKLNLLTATGYTPINNEIKKAEYIVNFEMDGIDVEYIKDFEAFWQTSGDYKFNNVVLKNLKVTGFYEMVDTRAYKSVKFSNVTKESKNANSKTYLLQSSTLTVDEVLDADSIIEYSDREGTKTANRTATLDSINTYFGPITVKKKEVQTIMATTEGELIDAANQINNSKDTIIKLGKDIKLTKFIRFYVLGNVTLDLAGNTLDVTEHNLTFYYGYKDENNYNFRSNLIIKDSGTGNNGKITGVGFNGRVRLSTIDMAEELKNLPKAYGFTIDGGTYAVTGTGSWDENVFDVLSDSEPKKQNITLNVNVKKGVFEVGKVDGNIFHFPSSNDTNMKANFNFETLMAKGLGVKLGSNILGKKRFDEVVPSDTKIYYTDSNQVIELEDRTKLVMDVRTDTSDSYPQYIKLAKEAGLSVENVTLPNVTFGYTDVPEATINITNIGADELKITNVKVSDTDKFEIIGSTQPTIGIGTTNADFKVKAKTGLDAGEYKATITLTDANSETYKATVTLNVSKKELTGLGISFDPNTWKYGETTKTPTITGVEKLTPEEYKVTYSKETGESLGETQPTLVGKYKATLSVTSTNYFAIDVTTTFEIKPDPISVSVSTEQELIDAVKGLDPAIYEIKLTKDITLTKYLNFYVVNDITLDLNGQTLDTGSEGLSFNYGMSDYDETNNEYYYNFNSKLTIKDSSSGKTGKILTKKSIMFTTYDVTHDEEIKKYGLTIDGGYYEISSSTTTFISLFTNESYTNGRNITVDVKVKDAVFKIGDQKSLFGTSSDSDSDIKFNFNFESLKVLGLASKLGSNKLGKMKLDNVIDPNSKAYFQELPYTTGAPVLTEANRNTLVENFYASGGENPYIIIKKVNGFEINNVEINETYDATPSLNDISIKNISENALEVKSVTVDSSDFIVEGPSTQPTIGIGATNTDFKVKANTGLNAGEYTATITVTDANDETYTATVTLNVSAKALTGLGINGVPSTWEYGTAQTPTATGVEGLTADDYEINYSKKNEDSTYTDLGTELPKLVGEYKATLKIKNSNYTASEASVDFSITPITTEVKVKSHDETFTYDGTEHAKNVYDVLWANNASPVTDNKLPNGDKVTAVITGKVKDVKDTKIKNNTIGEITITNATGDDVTSCYSNIARAAGKLTVNPITTPIVVTADPATKAYDGTDLTKNTYTYTDGVLVTGDTIEVTITGSQKFVGSSNNTVSNVKVMRNGEDITSNYTMGTHVDGTLEVTSAEQPLEIADQYVKVNGSITKGYLEQSVTGNEGNISFTIKSGIALTYDAINEEYVAGATAGDVVMTVTAVKVNLGGDDTPEWKETSKDFTIHVINKTDVNITGLNNNEEFTYDGTSKKPTGTISVNAGTINVSDLEVKYEGTGSTTYNAGTAPTNVGTYKVTYKVPEDNTSYVGTYSVEFSIKKAGLDKVTLVEDTFEYTGTDITPTLNNVNDKIEISGTTTAKDVSNNVITAKIKDISNYEWKDGSNGDLTINWSITQATPDYTVPTGLTGVKGETLNDVTLPSGFTWNDTTVVLTAGTNTYKATYTPVDTTNYKTITDIDIEINVKNKFDVITSVNGGNGTITPSKIDVIEGTKEEITFTPDSGYVVSKVMVNEVEKTSEVENNKIEITVTEEITVEVTYKRKYTGGGGGSTSTTTYKIIVTEGKNGSITPNGVVKVEKGEDQTFKIKAEKGYEIADVLVDGKSVGAVAKYTFKNVKAKHTIEATFKKVEMPEQKPEEKETFKDVKKNDWYYEAVEYVANKGLMNGTGNDEFTPDANTTRGMIVTILYRLEGSPEVSMSTFTDVANTEYYAKAVAWAEKNGIVNGYGEGKFGPNDVITREQLAAIMYRYSNYKKYNTSVGEDTNILSYNDISELSEYAVSSMQWACGAGLVNGIGDGKLAPKGNATRAQLATILMRYCESNK